MLINANADVYVRSCIVRELAHADDDCSIVCVTRLCVCRPLRSSQIGSPLLMMFYFWIQDDIVVTVHTQV